MATIRNPQVLAIFTKLASLAGVRAYTLEKQITTAREKAAAVAEPLLKDLLDKQIIQPGEEKQAREMLGTHEGTLQLLKGAALRLDAATKALTERSKSASEVGHAEADPNGPAVQKTVRGSVNSPYVGARTPEVRPSDRALLKVLEAPRR